MSFSDRKNPSAEYINLYKIDNITTSNFIYYTYMYEQLMQQQIYMIYSLDKKKRFIQRQY